MPGVDLKQVRLQIPIHRVLDLLGFVPTAHVGLRLRSAYPNHHDSRQHRKAFSVHPGCHRCFHCHSAGTQLDLWAAVHGLTIHAAADDLCRRIGLPRPYLAPSTNHHPDR